MIIRRKVKVGFREEFVLDLLQIPENGGSEGRRTGRMAISAARFHIQSSISSVFSTAPDRQYEREILRG